ncbi:MAG: polyprenyl synthetase family protein [Pseudomonadota bacterium]
MAEATDTAAHLKNIAASVTRDMDQLLAELKAPERLVAAMRHAVLAGGKRIRPVLILETAHLLSAGGRMPTGSAEVAMAMECIHTYSLIHDDLPSMDNDDLRRGQPTVHKAFDEATAILAGDALQALGFELVASSGHPAIAAIVRDLASASGAPGMVGGQLLDLAAEGRFGAAQPIKDTYALAAMQSMKTGALIEASCTIGARLALAPLEQQQRIRQYGTALGLAFQISDDLLDVRGSTDEVGKRTGKDAEAGKTTWPGLLGVEQAQKALDSAVEDAVTTLEPYGAAGDNLKWLARSLRDRTR